MTTATKNQKSALSLLAFTAIIAFALILFCSGCSMLSTGDPQVAPNAAPNVDPGPTPAATAELVADLLSNPLTVQVITQYLKTGELDPANLLTPENVAHLAKLLENPLTLTLIQTYLSTGDIHVAPAPQAPSTGDASVAPSNKQAELDALLKKHPEYATPPPGWDAPAANGDTPPGVTP